MPYEPSKCTYFEDPVLLGRQHLFTCLTCATTNAAQPIVICYSCSIQCHSEHDLVELFTKRGLACDCGTTRMQTGCKLRKNADDDLDKPINDDKVYENHNMQGRFCVCDREYNPEEEKGTMIQCLLGDCGEDWYHEECILGLPLGSEYKDEEIEEDQEQEQEQQDSKEEDDKKALSSVPQGVNLFDQMESASSENVKAPEDVKTEQDQANADNDAGDDEEDADDDEDNETLQGLPNINEFESFVCWKCVEKNKPFFLKLAQCKDTNLCLEPVIRTAQAKTLQERLAYLETLAKKRVAPTDEQGDHKRVKTESGPSAEIEHEKESSNDNVDDSLLPSLSFSLFLPPKFRAHITQHLPTSDTPLAVFKDKFPFLIADEPTYLPPPDDDANSSLLDAGAAALNQIPRQQALRGIQAYSMIKAKLNDFFKPFAEQGKVVTEGDVVGFFEQVKSERRNS